jgi:hypothetical protein
MKAKAAVFLPPRKVDTYLAGSRTPESDNFNSHRSERLSAFPELGFLVCLMTSKVERGFGIELGIRTWIRTALCEICG